MTQSRSDRPYTFAETLDATEYDKFVKSQPTCNLLQSSAWAKVKHTWGHRLTVLRDTTGEIRAAGLILIRPIKLGYTMWYLPHGPILDYDASDAKAVLEAYLRAVAGQARKTRCVFVKIDPPLALQAAALDEITGEYNPKTLAFKEIFEAAGFFHQGFPKEMHATLQPRFCAITLRPEIQTSRENKTISPEDFEASLPKRTRTFARNARNRYVQVRCGGTELIDEFLGVIRATEEKKGIRLRGKEYYETILRAYGDDAKIWLAYLELDKAIAAYRESEARAETRLADLGETAPKKTKQLEEEIERLRKRRKELEQRRPLDGEVATLAGVLMVQFGSGAELLYAGTNRDYGNITAQELAWVEALGKGFASVRYVNMGGISGSLDDELTAFKSRYNAVIVEKLGEFDLPLRGLLYRAVRFYLRHR